MSGLQIAGVVIIGYLFIAPLITFVHELGHAIVGLIASGEEVRVEVGVDRGRTKRRCGRLTFDVGLVGGFIGFYEIEGWERLTRRGRVGIALGGPGATFMMLVVSIYGFWNAPDVAWLRLLAGFTGNMLLLQFVFTVTPLRYPSWMPGYGGLLSDGGMALEEIRARHES